MNILIIDCFFSLGFDLDDAEFLALGDNHLVNYYQ
jgi:hypothetical protein